MSKKGNLTGLKKQAVEFQLKQYPKFQIFAGSTNKYEYKTVYYALQFHFESLTDDHIKTIRNFIWYLKQTMYRFLKYDAFDSKYLLDIDAPASIRNTGFGCIKLEFTLYPNDIYTKEQMTQTLEYLSELITKNNFSNTEQYRIYRSLNDVKQNRPI